MDGLTLAQNVKKIDSYKFIPIIMLTTVSAQDQMQVGREAGVKAWIVKPFEPKKLSGAVAKLLGI
jgi:two-component system chemotaxis response regulator CheY